jgi:predicted Zn-dependent protease
LATPTAHAGLISKRSEISAGEQAAAQLERQYGVSRDRQANALVQQIGRRLARLSSRPDLPWEFKVLNNSTINAVSLPGGKVYVFKGLLEALEDDRPMLAGVMAHEVGHVASRHHTEMMERQMTGSLLIGMLFEGKTRDIAGIFGNLYALKWSRKDEYEADRVGVRLAAKAGYDPHGLVRFLELLQSRYGGGSRSGPSSWLATHPATSERVKRADIQASAVERG